MHDTAISPLLFMDVAERARFDALLGRLAEHSQHFQQRKLETLYQELPLVRGEAEWHLTRSRGLHSTTPGALRDMHAERVARLTPMYKLRWEQAMLGVDFARDLSPLQREAREMLEALNTKYAPQIAAASRRRLPIAEEKRRAAAGMQEALGDFVALPMQALHTEHEPRLIAAAKALNDLGNLWERQGKYYAGKNQSPDYLHKLNYQEIQLQHAVEGPCAEAQDAYAKPFAAVEQLIGQMVGTDLRQSSGRAR